MSKIQCGCGSAGGRAGLYGVCGECGKVLWRYDVEKCPACECDSMIPKCLSCATNEVNSAHDQFIGCLNEEQKKLFALYKRVEGIKTSMIILD